MKMVLGLKSAVECKEVTAEIFVNQQLVAHTSACTKEFITEINLPETPADHVIEISMSGKDNRHTHINDQGDIVYDVAFIVETLNIEDIDMKPIFCQGHVCYNHRANNPANAEIQDEFYGYIGHNGCVKIEFSTPIYLWFLKHFDY